MLRFLKRFKYGTIFVFAVLFYILLGYAKPPRLTAEPLSFEQQIEQVRRGESVEIRVLTEAVTDEQMARLAGLESLERLNLPRGRFSDAGLAQLADLPNLTLLRFGSPHVTDEGMQHVAALKNLRFLHLIGVPISDEGLRTLEQMTWLESFYLDGGRTTGKGLSRLLTALPELHFHKDQQHLPRDPHADGH